MDLAAGALYLARLGGDLLLGGAERVRFAAQRLLQDTCGRGRAWSRRARNLRTLAGSRDRISGRTQETAAENCGGHLLGGLLHLARARGADVLVGQRARVDDQPRQLAIEVEHRLQRGQQVLGRLAELPLCFASSGQPLAERVLGLGPRRLGRVEVGEVPLVLVGNVLAFHGASGDCGHADDCDEGESLGAAHGAHTVMALARAVNRRACVFARRPRHRAEHQVAAEPPRRPESAPRPPLRAPGRRVRRPPCGRRGARTRRRTG